MHWSLRASFVAAVLACGSACNEPVVVGHLRSHGEAGAPDDSQVPLHPELDVGDGPGPTCEEGAPSHAFRFALCSCEDVVGNGTLSVDAFDSAQGPFSEAGTGGSVGVDGAFRPARVILGGSLWVGSADGGILLGGELEVGGDLLCEGPLGGDVEARVEGSARVGGDIQLARLSIGGTLTQPSDASLVIEDGTAPSPQPGPAAVPPRCDCTAQPDIPSQVTAIGNDSDNARIELAPDALDSQDAARELALPAGRYALPRILAVHPITVTLEGRVTLAIEGDVTSEVGGPVRFQLGPGAELDLLVAGAITAADDLYLGDAATAGRARLYVGTPGTLELSGRTVVAGAVFAPHAEVVASGDLEIFGALLTQRFSYAASVALHYDQALARDDCAGAACTSASDCGTRTCGASGRCIACDEAAACAPDLHCAGGSCIP